MRSTLSCQVHGGPEMLRAALRCDQQPPSQHLDRNIMSRKNAISDQIRPIISTIRPCSLPHDPGLPTSMAAVGSSRPISAAMRHSTDWHTFRTIVTDMTVLRTCAALGLSMRLWHWTVRHWRHERACIGQPWPCFAPPSDPSNTTEYGVHDKESGYTRQRRPGTDERWKVPCRTCRCQRGFPEHRVSYDNCSYCAYKSPQGSNGVQFDTLREHSLAFLLDSTVQLTHHSRHPDQTVKCV